MKKKSALALTLGLGLAVGGLTLGVPTTTHANQRPAGIHNTQTGHEKPISNQDDHPQMLALLQVDEQTFQQEVNSGKSLMEIGASHNVSRQTIIDLIVKNMTQQIDKSVADKSISAQQATEMKTNAVEKAQQMVDLKPMGVNKMHDEQALQDMLTLLKIDEQTFKQEVNSGKSLTEIGSTHNIPRQDIVNLLAKNMTQQIDKGLAEKHITAQQAEEMKTNAEQKAQDMVDRKTLIVDEAQSKQNHQEMLTLLQVDEQTFKQEVDSGKSLKEIGASHNVPRQEIVDLVVKNMTQQIDKALLEKHITAPQAEDMKTTTVQNAQEIVDKSMLVH